VTSSAYDNIYVAKIDPAGNFLWVKQAAGTHYHMAGDVGTDALGNAFSTGWFRAQATFDSTNLISSGTTDMFLARLGDCGEWSIVCPKDVVLTDCPAVAPDFTADLGITGACGPLSDYLVTQNPPAGTALGSGIHPVGITVTAPNGVQQECVVIVAVDCDGCETQSVSLNTGFNHANGTLYPVGAPDPFWTVVADPDAGTTEPRPAAVINQHSAWQPALPNSRWISAYPTPNNNLNGPYDLQTTFCLLPGWKGVELELCLRADDWAEVYLNGTLIATTPNPSFNNTPTCVTVTNQALFSAASRERASRDKSSMTPTATGSGMRVKRRCQAGLFSSPTEPPPSPTATVFTTS
jgi:hypothetical protein